MGEEEKKSEEKKPEEPEQVEEEKKGEAKPAEKPEESKKDAKAEEAAPPAPPPEIVLKVFMHCEGCARKVRRSLKGFPGVEDVITDCKSHKVVVKGDKADPLKVLERVQRKSHRQVELLSPIPKPPEEKKLPEQEPKPEPEPVEKKQEIVTVILKVHMHCEACAQEMKRRIQRMKGVESAEPDLKNSQVSVKGVYDPAMLVEYVHKRLGKHAVIVKQEPEKKEKVEEAKEEKKTEEGEKEEEEEKSEGEENKEKKEEEEKKSDAKPEEKEEVVATEETNKVAEMKKNEYYYTPQRYGMDLYAYPAYSAYYQYHAYPPQIFSDENPNACTVM